MISKGKTFRQFLDDNHEYDFSSTQINLPVGLAMRILSWSDEAVPDERLHRDPDDPSFGREEEPHITVLYGLHTSDPRPVEKVVRKVKPFEVVLKKMSLFTSNDQFDVLKIDVEGRGLHELHRTIGQNLKATESYPTFIPHVTIAYVKKGVANEFVGCGEFDGESFTVGEIVFSSKTRRQTEIKIGEQ